MTKEDYKSSQYVLLITQNCKKKEFMTILEDIKKRAQDFMKTLKKIIVEKIEKFDSKNKMVSFFESGVQEIINVLIMKIYTYIKSNEDKKDEKAKIKFLWFFIDKLSIVFEDNIKAEKNELSEKISEILFFDNMFDSYGTLNFVTYFTIKLQHWSCMFNDKKMINMSI
ncbi:hypothetical protein GVAV_002012 [Gurleya vavrai]